MSTYDNLTAWFFDNSLSCVRWETGLKEAIGFTDAEVLNLSGAPARSTVKVEKFALSDENTDANVSGIRLTVENNILLAEPTIRDILFTTEGMVLTSVLYNKIFHLRPEFRGLKLGARSCAIEIYQAKALEFSRIDVWAIGNAQYSKNRKSDGAMSGFAVWPRLGFDGPIPESVHAKIPRDLCPENLAYISSLMASHKGVEFWDEMGDECKLSFDLGREICWATLKSYLEANSIRVEP